MNLCLRNVFLLNRTLSREAKGLGLTVDEDTCIRAMFLLELYRKAVSLHKNELYDYFLDQAVNVTNSKIGFFHFVNDDEKTIALTAWK